MKGGREREGKDVCFLVWRMKFSLPGSQGQLGLCVNREGQVHGGTLFSEKYGRLGRSSGVCSVILLFKVPFSLHWVKFGLRQTGGMQM